MSDTASEYKKTQLHPGVPGTVTYIPLPTVYLQETLDNYLIFASQCDDFPAVRYSLKKGASVHAYHGSALREAFESPHVDVADILLNSGADIRTVQQTSTLDRLPLMDVFPVVYNRKELLARLAEDKQEQYRAFTGMMKESLGNHLGGTDLSMNSKRYILRYTFRGEERLRDRDS